MTEQDWLTAWTLYRNGLNFAEIERYFGKGHRTIAGGFIRKGWYDPATKSATSLAPDAKRQPEPARTSFVGHSRDIGSDKGWTPTRLFLAHWLLERGNSPERVAEVVNVPLTSVQKYAGQIERAAA